MIREQNQNSNHSNHTDQPSQGSGAQPPPGWKADHHWPRRFQDTDNPFKGRRYEIKALHYEEEQFNQIPHKREEDFVRDSKAFYSANPASVTTSHVENVLF